MIQPCSCAHSFQDERYGKGQRVMNVMKDTSKCRCTVCLTIHNTRSIKLAEEPKKK